MINFYLEGNTTLQNENTVFQNKNVFTLNYPCKSSDTCNSFYSDFLPGKYTFKLYGASGGFVNNRISTSIKPDFKDCVNQEEVTKYNGNTECKLYDSSAGAGGYTSGTLILHKTTRCYITIGGSGEYRSGTSSYEDRTKGGFNGGGRGFMHQAGSSGGGGATDIRLIENDLWHRVLVAGAGGGSDDCFGNIGNTSNNGAGGAGGGLEAQGFWLYGVYNDEFVANQTNGFSFGNGEAAQEKGSRGKGTKNYGGSSDRSGAGGGWFGGFSSHNGNGGSGGGSSFAFNKDAVIPSGEITATNDLYESPESHAYAFSKERDEEYFIHKPIFIQGIWKGNGKAIIIYSPFAKTCINSYRRNPLSIMIYVLIIRNC